jgi:hypothetical protein
MHEIDIKESCSVWFVPELVPIHFFKNRYGIPVVIALSNGR